MINTSYWIECDDCGEILHNQWSGDILFQPSVRSLNLAASRQGWHVVRDELAFCPECYKEYG